MTRVPAEAEKNTKNAAEDKGNFKLKNINVPAAGMAVYPNSR